ncbi:mitochondrial small ribosomal subunit protein uS17m [Patescibacteria group bacterium]|nr:mitochondrial small ribosomal subunit protein uS17m [Patescibacteria group bacterium]
MKKEIIKTTTKREKEGVVVGNKMTGTVRVEIEEISRHKEYSKVMRKQKVFFAHTNEALEIGDKVTIRESKPFAKNVNWVVVSKK